MEDDREEEEVVVVVVEGVPVWALFMAAQEAKDVQVRQLGCKYQFDMFKFGFGSGGEANSFPSFPSTTPLGSFFS